jgi:hypothetical protein
MPHDELLQLLAKARAVLDRHLFEADGKAVRDDVAEICMAIDDALPPQPPRLPLTATDASLVLAERTAA